MTDDVAKGVMITSLSFDRIHHTDWLSSHPLGS